VAGCYDVRPYRPDRHPSGKELVTQTLTVPLFPLPRTVLFPGVRLPFYVFEPRYRRMLADLLDGPGLVGIPQVLPGFESASSGAPPFNQIFGVHAILTASRKAAKW